MPVSFGSLSSGLPPDIVDKIMEAERCPVRIMESQKADFDKQKKLISELRTKVAGISVNDIGDIYDFWELKTVSSSPDVVSATVDKRKATPGTYNIEVVQLARRSSAVSTPFPDKNESQVGVGYISFELPDGEEKQIYIGPNENTLEGVASAINKAKIGFRANVIEDGSDGEKKYRVLISGQDTGSGNAVKWPHFYLLDGDYDFYVDQDRPAQNAKVKIDGFEMEVPENKAKDIVPGLNIDIHKAKPGEEISITIKEDIESMSDKVKKLVESTNKVIDFIQQQNTLDASSNTRNTLGGDITLTTIENRFRSVFSNWIPGATERLSSLSQIGVSFQRSGRLAFDEKKFAKVLSDDFNGVAQLFVGVGDGKTGLIPILKQEIKAMTDSGTGMLSSREEGLGNRVKSIDQNIGRKLANLEKKESQLKDMFAKLESSMASLKNQGAYMAQALGGGAGSVINMGAAKVS
jgi:flagellar hook-associated protein 2